MTRLNRRALIAVSIVGACLIFGALLIALQPPSLVENAPSEELYNITNKTRADALEALPKQYDEMPPKLGPPLPGDLGPAVLMTEQAAGLTEPMAVPDYPLPFRADPMTDAERAARIRRAQQAEQARESDIFFQVSGTSGREAAPLANTAQAPVFGDGQSGLTGNQPPQTGQERPAGQQGRIAFLNQRPNEDVYSRHPLLDPISDYEVKAGTILAASLLTGINSDLPGTVIAQVTENVYDTVLGQFLLIPQGSRLIGQYDSVIASGQQRALVIWQRLIMPNGTSIVLDNLPAVDVAGYAGLEDEVDFHTFRLLRGIALATLLGVSSEVAINNGGSDLVNAIRESSQDTTNQVGQRFVERELSIPPTITIRPGWPLRVIVNKDIILRPYVG